MIRAPGRNDRCTCGSGKRYKECCGRVEATSGPDTAPSIHELMNAALAEQRARVRPRQVTQLRAHDAPALVFYERDDFGKLCRARHRIALGSDGGDVTSASRFVD